MGKEEKKDAVLRLVEAQIAGCVDLSPEEMVEAAFIMVEKIEENDSFRFIENRKDCYYINAHCKTLSVDTPKDRVQVERYMIENGLAE